MNKSWNGSHQAARRRRIRLNQQHSIRSDDSISSQGTRGRLIMNIRRGGTDDQVNQAHTPNTDVGSTNDGNESRVDMEQDQVRILSSRNDTDGNGSPSYQPDTQVDVDMVQAQVRQQEQGVDMVQAQVRQQKQDSRKVRTPARQGRSELPNQSHGRRQPPTVVIDVPTEGFLTQLESEDTAKSNMQSRQGQDKHHAPEDGQPVGHMEIACVGRDTVGRTVHEH